MVETNTFGGSPVTLGEFDLADRAFEINKIAGELAREAAETFADGRHRWVIGSVGPGTKLPSLGNIAYDPLEAALAEQCRGLIAGGVDAILIETCQDTLADQGRGQRRQDRPRARPAPTRRSSCRSRWRRPARCWSAPTSPPPPPSSHALDVPLMGLNCATGPQEMAEHVGWLAANWPGLISVQPNAGLPELVDGHTHYPLGAAELASWLERFVARGRGEPDRRLLRHLNRRISRRWMRCCASGGGVPAGAGGAQADLGAGRRQPVPGGAAAAGKRHLRDRRALQRQRLEEVAGTAGDARLGRLRRHGPRADRRRLARAGHLHRLRRPRRNGRDERGDPPLHRLGEQRRW